MRNVSEEEREKAKRNIMMMQMFNYDRTNRDSEQRPIEMSAAVAAGSKFTFGKVGKAISMILIILVVCAIFYIFMS